MAFEEKFFAGELTPTLKSEEPADEDLAEPVKVVKGKSFSSMVLENGEPIQKRERPATLGLSLVEYFFGVSPTSSGGPGVTQLACLIHSSLALVTPRAWCSSVIHSSLAGLFLESSQMGAGAGTYLLVEGLEV